MASNSKLTAYQKNDLRYFKRNGLPGARGLFVSYPHLGVTLLVTRERPGSKMVQVTASLMSADEKKWRTKVGQFHAFDRFENGEFLTVPADFDQEAFAESISLIVPRELTFPEISG